MSAIADCEMTLPATGASTDRIIGRLLAVLPHLDAHAAHTPGRAGVEQYIAQKFAQAYGASVTEFMPVLLSLNCGHRLSAAVGLRAAQQTGLFLEQYLDCPIEQLIGQACERPVSRAGVVEIGNLVATYRGASQLLFILLSLILAQAGFQWVAFTATAQVQKNIGRLGIRTHYLADADPRQLSPEKRQAWGSYYDSRPRVIVAEMAGNMESLQQQRLIQYLSISYRHRLSELARFINYPNDLNDTSVIAA